MDTAEELLTADEVGARLRVSPSTIHLWARDGLVPAVRVNAKIIRFDLHAVIRALSSSGVHSEQEQEGR